MVFELRQRSPEGPQMVGCGIFLYIFLWCRMRLKLIKPDKTMLNVIIEDMLDGIFMSVVQLLAKGLQKTQQQNHTKSLHRCAA